MAENDAMEGKDLAIKEKKEFEERVLEAIQNLKEGQTTISTEGLEVTNNKDNYIIKLKGIPFGLIRKDGKFTYNKENFRQVKKALGEEGITLEELGLPDIEQWIDQEEKDQEIDEFEKDEKDLSDDIKAKEEKETEEKRDKKVEDEAKEEIARRYRVSPNQVVHISTGARSKRVTDKEHFSEIAKWAEKYDDIFILPGEDEYSWETIGVDKDGKEEVINNRQLEGKNPDVTIKMENENSSNEEIQEIRPLAMYEIDSHTSYAIVRDSAGKTQAVLCRQEEGKGKEYWGQVIPEAQGKNVREASPESREAISPEHYSAYDLAKRGQAFEDAKSLEKRGYPSKEGKGVQMEEITGTPAQNRELSKEAIINDLADRVIAKSSMPMNKDVYIKIHREELSKKAEKILTMGEEHDDMTYEDALKEVENQSKEAEEDQKTPDQNPRKRGH